MSGPAKIGPDTTRELEMWNAADPIDAAHAAGVAEGVAQERARVVADLRAEAAELEREAVGPDPFAPLLEDLADRYQRGDHVAEEER